MNVVPKLTDLLSDHAKAALVPSEAIPAMLGELERLKATLWALLTAPQGNGQAHETGDRLLDVKETAAKMNISEGHLYREHRKLPFTVHLGNKLLFSNAGIEKWIRQRVGNKIFIDMYKYIRLQFWHGKKRKEA